MHIDNETILVTGGAGFIGSHVTHRLLDHGADVAVVDDLFAGHREYVPEDATFHEVDIRTDEFESVVQRVDPDGIVHLAAIHYIPYCNEHPEDAFDVNVMGTRKLLAGAKDLDGLDRVVYASSAAVYPAADAAHAETDDPGPMDIYGRTKLVGEDLIEQFSTDTGVSAASARLFNVYGPRETNEHLIPAIIDQLDDGSHSVELGNLSPARDFVHVRDVARAFVALLEASTDGHRRYNVGTGEERTVREVAESVGTALGRDIEVTQAQDRVRESDRPHLRADIGRIEREIGWEPTVEFVAGLRDLLQREVIEA